MHETLVVCPECDASHRWRPVGPGERARCVRCGAVLFRRSRLRTDQMLALLWGALLVFVLANAYPIVALDVRGVQSGATVMGCILALWNEGQGLVAALVFVTIVLIPLVDLIVMLALFQVAVNRRRPAMFAVLFRFIQALRPWGMIEVFMLGVLVALVKLSNMAHVQPGVALWAFGVLTFLLAAIASFDLRAHFCALWLDEGAFSGYVKHTSRYDSLSRTWAYLTAAMIMYIPANLLPMMETSSLIRNQRDTILSGVIYFWTSGSYGLATLIFVASIVVPLLKMGTLLLLTVSVYRRSRHGARQRALLFRIVEIIGRWSMLDVFVVALMVGFVQFRTLATVHPGSGAAAFGAVVVLTMLASHSFDPRLIWNDDKDDHG